MNRAAFLHRLGLGFLAGLFARESSATTDLLPGAPDTADAVPADEPSDTLAGDVVYTHTTGSTYTIYMGPDGQWCHQDGSTVQRTFTT